jgi:hypothetical protein
VACTIFLTSHLDGKKEIFSKLLSPSIGVGFD